MGWDGIIGLNFVASNLRRRVSGQQELPDQPPSPPSAETSAPPLPRWMQRLSLVIFVIFCIELGMLLLVLPWTRIWTENSLFSQYPTLKAFALNDFIRGVISGLGLVDIWIGIWEAVRYREVRRH